MLLRQLTGKKICILGFGREGQATLKALERAGVKEMAIADRSDELRDTSYEIIKGEQYLDHLHQFDVIIKSPGIKPSSKLEALRSKLTSATQIFFDEVKARGAMIIGVTGTKGKSTTSSLIFAILKAAGKDAHLVGNIGIPAIDCIDRAHQRTIFVMELSSYQLMDLKTSPHIAVLTSFFPEHLDYHGTVEAYLDAKKHITRFQTKDDIVIFNNHFKETQAMAQESMGKKIAYTENDAPLTMDQTKLLGTHNLGNIQAAWCVSKELKIDEKTALDAIKNFQGLPHRLQSLGTQHDVEWVDDAISTTPESAIAAIDALGDRVGSIILGGQDRGLDFTSLAKRLATSSIKHVILFGEDGARIGDAIKTEHPSIHLHPAKSIQEVVAIAKEVTPKGTVCLLSPASPSYDMFKNYEEKGDIFAREIRR